MSATSQLKHIRRLNQTAPAIERPACNSRPQNDCVGLASSAPRKRFVQQFFAQSVVPHFGNNIKIGQVRMKLGLVNGGSAFSQSTARKYGRVTVCHLRRPSSATGKSQSENASSSMMCICAGTATSFPSPSRFPCEIDSASQPGHSNRLILPGESAR